MILYFARRYDEAITEIEETLELAPDFGPARIMLGRAYIAKGMADRAVKELERAQGLLGPRPDVIALRVRPRSGRTPPRSTCNARWLAAITKPRDPRPSASPW